MKKKRENAPPQTARDALRRRPRQLPGQQQTETRQPRTVARTQQLLDRLQVHQTELHLLKEELRQTKQVLEALRESERLAHSTIDALPAQVCVLDETGTIVSVNKAWREAAAAGEPLAQNAAQGVNYLAVCDATSGPGKENASEFAAGIRAVMKGERNEFCLEYPCHSPVGQRWHIGRVTRFPAKYPAFIAVVYEDITQHKRAEAALRESEERYRLLIDHSNDAVLLSTPDGRILAANPEACRIFGRTEEEICQVGRAGLVDPTDLRLTALLEERGRTGKARGEATFVRKDGTRFPGEMSSTIFLDRAGNPRTSIIIRDITGGKRLEELRRKELKRTSTLLKLYNKAPELTDKEIFDYALQEAVNLTDSTIGYLHRVNDDQTTLSLTAWNKTALRECTAVYDTHYRLSEAGIWADCARQRRPMVHNDYQGLANKKGYPTGHPHVVRQMSFPVIDGDSIKLILGVGNKDTDYDHDDITHLRSIANELHKIMVCRQVAAALAASETRYRVVADNTYDWEFWQGPDGRFIYSSPSCERITGCRPAEFEADPTLLVRLIHPDDRPRFEAHRRQAVSSHIMAEEEFRIVRPDGGVRWIDHLCGPVYDEAGKFLGTRGSNRDMTERKHLEEKLCRSEEQYRTLVENSPYCIYEINCEGRLISMNRAGLAMMDARDEGEIQGVLYLQAVADVDKERIGQLLESAVQGQSSEFEFLASDGRVFASSFVPIRGTDGTVIRIIGLTQDITKRKEAEVRLLDYQQQLRSLSFELSRAEQQERRRIASLLHDDVIQSLALSRIKLGALRGWLSTPERQASLDGTRTLVEQAIQSTRSLTSQLSPPILYELGLEPALDWLTEQIAEQHGMSFRVASDRQPKPLDEDVKVLLFTATRELLLNVTKHARAANVTVSIRREDEMIRIIVEDDGVGFDTRESNIRFSETGGFGLFNIRERLGYLGGHCEVQSEPGRGTRVALAAPLSRAEGQSGPVRTPVSSGTSTGGNRRRSRLKS